MISIILTVLFITFVTCIGSYSILKLIYPILWRSRYVKLFKQRLSRSMVYLFLDLVATTYMHLETMCEPEGDEEFIPYLDSPLRTCPPCETIYEHPKEEIPSYDINGNSVTSNEGTNRSTRTRRSRLPAALFGQQNQGLDLHNIGFLLGVNQVLVHDNNNARRVATR